MYIIHVKHKCRTSFLSYFNYHQITQITAYIHSHLRNCLYSLMRQFPVFISNFSSRTSTVLFHTREQISCVVFLSPTCARISKRLSANLSHWEADNISVSVQLKCVEQGWNFSQM